MTKMGLIGPAGQWYENTWISPYHAETTWAVQEVFEAMEAGKADHLTPDPFYQRADGKPPFSDEDIDRIILAIDEEYDTEMRVYPVHHLNRSGADARTELHRLPPLARRYLVELLDAIKSKHRDIDQSSPVNRSQQEPEYSGESC